ncbi:MAG TPA: hypothetical protein VIL11_00045 [Limnochordales bacterium]
MEHDARSRARPRRPGRRTAQPRPTADQEAAPEPQAGLTAIDNPDDADLYPPTETPRSASRRRQGVPRKDS